MNNIVWKNIGRFVLLMALQLLVLNYVYLGGYVMPMLYVLFILMLPTYCDKLLLLSLAFLSGLCVDIFSNTLGFHTFAATLIGFMRIIFADRIITQNDKEKKNYFNNSYKIIEF